MGLYKYINETWKQPKKNLGALWQQRLIKFRREPAVLRVEKPTRIDKARTLGYKAKQGIVMARVRVPKGGRERAHDLAGRRPKRSGLKRFTPKKSRQLIAEERVAKKYPNLELLNSYFVSEDGQHLWYEAILLDKNHPAIQSDRTLGWICGPANTGRVFRGLTSAGKKSRGLVRSKGIGVEKMRPSLRANKNRGK
ncbi:MAG: 50S ribosomal protein L15e [DPANN group archaeon]|nr:50S ribosomal protein L15e [DPANN group archaeon]